MGKDPAHRLYSSSDKQHKAEHPAQPVPGIALISFAVPFAVAELSAAAIHRRGHARIDIETGGEEVLFSESSDSDAIRIACAVGSTAFFALKCSTLAGSCTYVVTFPWAEARSVFVK